MLRLSIVVVGALTVIGVGTPLRAGTLQDFSFNDPDGTPLTAAVNQSQPSNHWVGAGDWTVQGGRLVVSSPEGLQNTFSLQLERPAPNRYWLVVEIPQLSSQNSLLDVTLTSPTEELVGFEWNSQFSPSGWFDFEVYMRDHWNPRYKEPVVEGPLNVYLDINAQMKTVAAYYRAGQSSLVQSNLSRLDSFRRFIEPTRLGLRGTDGFQIDRIYMTDQDPLGTPTYPLELQINQDTGQAQLYNPSTETVALRGYRITSDRGSLLPEPWSGLFQSGNVVDGPDPGEVAGDHPDERWTISAQDRHELAERFELGVQQIASGESLSLGTFYSTQGYEDLQFSFDLITTSGLIERYSQVHYQAPILNGDLGRDRRVDASDAAVVIADWGGPGTLFGSDINGDGTVDAADMGIVFGEWTGDAVSVPEPAAFGPLLLLVSLTSAVCASRSIRSTETRLER